MKLKNKILVGMLSLCAAFAGFGAMSVNGVTAAADETAATATTAEYTVVDSYVMVKTSDVNSAKGDFNLWITLPQLDIEASITNVKSISTVGLFDKLEAIAFFDNILIGNKTLKECGVQGFATEVVDFGSGEPQNVIRMTLHADPATFVGLINSGEIVLGRTAVTIKEGALIPSYHYLTGGENPVVYRAGCDYLTKWSDFDAAFSYETFGQTYVESVAYTQGHDGTCGYFGFSLHGDDYLGDGEQVDINQTIFWFNETHYNGRFFTQSILVNGEAGKIKPHGLVNLGEKGKGHFSPQIYMHEDEVETVTIPKGTIFPARALNELKALNAPHNVHVFYETTVSVTYYKTEDGSFISSEDYFVSKLTDYKAEEGFFRAAEEAQRLEIVENAAASIRLMDDSEEMEAAFNEAITAIDALKSAAQYADEELAPAKAAAREEISSYKAGVTYLEETAAVYVQVKEDGLAAVAAAKSEEEINAAIAAAKEAMDVLMTREHIINDAKAAVDSYLADEEYRAEQQAEKAAILSTAKADIDNATTEADVLAIVEKACADIDALPTAAELRTAELDNSRKVALDKVNAKKATVDYARYSEENIAIINELYRSVKETIANSVNEADIDAAADKFAADIDALPKLERKDEAGCAAVLDEAGAVIGLMTAFGALVLLKKKENIA